MTLSNSILLGFLRFFVMFLFLYYINKKWINKSSSNSFVEFVVLQWFKYGALLGIIIFITVQLNIFDLLNTLLILLLLLIIELIGIQNLKNPVLYFNTKIKAVLIKKLKKIELNPTLKTWLLPKKKIIVKNNSNFVYLLTGIVVLVTFFSRFYFLKYDLYLLSNSWSSDLETMFNLDKQNWFYPNFGVVGELAFTNFYAKIFDVSPEIALQSIAVFEAILLTLIIFWLVQKCTNSRYFAPTLAALSFGLLYTIIPLNLNFLTQRNPIFLALTFTIPTLYFLQNPYQLKLKRISFFLSFIIAFVAIGLIDLLTFCILIPPFILISIGFTFKSKNILSWIALSAYLISVIIVFAIYYLMCLNFEIDFKDFIHSNLISVVSYTYIPQLIIPIDLLINYYFIAGFIAIIISIYFIVFRKKELKNTFIFLLYSIFLIILIRIKSPWIDADLLLQSMIVFFPILIGLSIGILIQIVAKPSEKTARFEYYLIGITTLIFLFSSFQFQKSKLNNFSNSDQLPIQILGVYDEIHSDYFPFTFAVVDQSVTQIVSENNHYFINYSDFLNNYLKKDAVYFKNQKQSKYFKQNPQDVIPNSILLFIYDDENKQKLLNQLAVLRRRGRVVQLVHKTEKFIVYEIINEPKSSKISDLIF